MNTLEQDLQRLLESLTVLPGAVRVEVAVKGGEVASAVVKFEGHRD